MAVDAEQNVEERVVGIAQTWHLKLRYVAVNDECSGDKHKTPKKPASWN